MQKEIILDEIHSSFNEIEYPFNEDFYKAIADRDYLEYNSSGKEKKWQEVTKEEIKKYYDFIFFLKEHAIIYYIPAYMKLIIQNNDVAENQCTECLFMALEKLNINKIDTLQAKTISIFLEYCKNTIHPEIELDEYLLDKAISKFTPELLM